MVVTHETLTALKHLRGDAGDCSDDDPVFGLPMQISRRVDSMAKAAGLGEGYSSHSGRVGLAFRMTRRGAPLQAVRTHGRWKSPSMPARYTRSEKAIEELEWLVWSVTAYQLTCRECRDGNGVHHDRKPSGVPGKPRNAGGRADKDE